MRRRSAERRPKDAAVSYHDLTKQHYRVGALATLAAGNHDGPTEAEGSEDRQFVTALARGLEILRAFRAGDGPLGNQDLVQRTGLPKATVSRLTYTLMKLGHLTYLERLGKYRIGPTVLALGYQALGSLTVRHVARPHLQAFADYGNLAVALGSHDRLSMIYLETCQGKDTMTLRLDIGTRIPLATTAMGRAFIAGLPERERRYLLDRMSRRYQSRWKTLKRRIDLAIHEVEERGFCTSFGDWQSDIHGVGVPLQLPDGAGLMALNCGGEHFLVTRERLMGDLGPRLVSVAMAIRAGLGG